MKVEHRAADKRAFLGISRAVVLLLLWGLVLAPSCGIFDTRDPEAPPNGGSETPREQPVNVDAVFFNYVNAVLYFDQGNYEETLADDFAFVPDPVDTLYFLSTLGTNVLRNWGLDEELTAVGRIFSDSESLAVTLVEESREEDSEQALIRLYYTFRQRIAREAEEDSIATFKGFAEIHMRADNSGFWSIDKWEDTEVSTEFFTWGRFKGNATGG